MTYPRYAISMKIDQALKIDSRSAKGALVLQSDNIRIVDADVSLVFAPKDPKNIYELASKVCTTRNEASLVVSLVFNCTVLFSSLILVAPLS